MANTLNLGTDGNWAVKKDSLLAYNDENDNFKPLPFDFTRASSATVVNKDGLIETVGSGEPRIDFLGNTKGALKLEPQSTNKIIQSQVFAGYTGTNAVIADNNTTSPDGLLTGASITDTSAGGTGAVQILSAETVDVSSTYTWSVFAKKKGVDYIALRPNGFTTPSSQNTFFDLNLGEIVTVGAGYTAKMEDYGSGWYRCSLTFTTDAVDTSGSLILRLSADGAVSTVTLDGTNSVYTWGWQFEKQSYTTSYIPTSGSAVTRNLETCTDAGNSTVINSTEGVLYFEGSALANGGDDRQISISDGSTSNRVSFQYNSSTNLLAMFVFIGGVAQETFTYTVADSTNISKVALKYKANDCSFYVNGVEVSSGIAFTGFSASTLSTLSFNRGSTSSPLYGNVKDVRVYNTALTDSELAILTTI